MSLLLHSFSSLKVQTFYQQWRCWLPLQCVGVKVLAVRVLMGNPGLDQGTRRSRQDMLQVSQQGFLCNLWRTSGGLVIYREIAREQISALQPMENSILKLDHEQDTWQSMLEQAYLKGLQLMIRNFTRPWWKEFKGKNSRKEQIQTYLAIPHPTCTAQRR